MQKTTIPSDAVNIIENNPVALSTVTPDGNPNVIGVACVKVIDETQLLITDVYMNQTLKDIAHNPKVAVVAWDKDMKGYKLLGSARYYSDGKYVEMVKSMPENQELKPKGAIVISIEKVIKSS